ncbi:MADS-box protein SOC1 [Morella rubra]|uniref:MADS-box protein SOC1 n=1 Tax=Morella rubra TaxID=262757 RepID=A0A6A1VDC7_9ROSI|nr:MADS-box protein SOC1 [Morella rubra]
MAKKIELLDVQKRKLLGDGLSSCPPEELQVIESQLTQSLRSIRERKAQLLMEQTVDLKQKERLLSEENKSLREKLSAQEKEIVIYCGRSSRVSDTDVETDLSIALPVRRCS